MDIQYAERSVFRPWQALFPMNDDKGIAAQSDLSVPASGRSEGFLQVPRGGGAAGLSARPGQDGDPVHLAQVRRFWMSLSDLEREHVANAYARDLADVSSDAMRQRMLGHLELLDDRLARQVGGKIGQCHMLCANANCAAGSKALQRVAVVLGDGFDRQTLNALRATFATQKIHVTQVAARVSGARCAQGEAEAVDTALGEMSASLYDAIIILSGEAGCQSLRASNLSEEWLSMAAAQGKYVAISGCEALFDALSQHSGLAVFWLDNSQASLTALMTEWLGNDTTVSPD